MIEDLKMQTCVCGCGELYKPSRNFQKFVNKDHQQVYWRNINKQAKKLVEFLGVDGVDKVLSGTYE